MSALKTRQGQFQDYLLRHDASIMQHIVGTSKVPPEVRLSIYADGYRLRLHEALATNYPVLKSVVGEDAFEVLANDYIDAYPSQYRSIRWFGDQLSAFIAEINALQPYLAELALFEWSLTTVFDSKEVSLCALEDIQAIPPDAWAMMRFKTHPSLCRLNLLWNVIPVWQSISHGQEAIEIQQSNETMPWVLWRYELDTHFSSLPAEEAWAIDALLNYATFGDICEGLCQWSDPENAALQAASFLKGWILAGLIASVE